MKKFFLVPVFLLVAVAMAYGQVAPDKLKIGVSKGVLKINNAKLKDAPWSLSLVTGSIGTAERIKDGYNTTHTYDKAGIVLFEPTADERRSGRVAEVQIYFWNHNENERSPNESTKVAVTLDKLKVTPDNELTLAKVRKKLKGWEESDSYMDHVYRFERKGIYVYVKFNDAETKIVKLSIGPAKKS